MAKRKQEINGPEGGWEPSTWYIVDVSYTEANPVHRSLFFTGFLDRYGMPHGYNSLVPLNGPDYEEAPDIGDVKTLKAIKRLFSIDEAQSK